MPTSLAQPSEPRPLYIPHREYPRPTARSWLSRAAAHFSLQSPFSQGEPWLPLTEIEGFLVLGHKEGAHPLGDFPKELCILVRLRPKDYDRIKARCMEALTVLQQTGKPSLKELWATSLVENYSRPAQPEDMPRPPEEAARRRAALHALQFIITHSLTARVSTGGDVPSFLKENRSAAWIIEAMTAGERIYPLDDLHLDRMRLGSVPDSIASKFKCICYERDDDGLHVILPAGTSRAVFCTELSARLDEEIPVNIAFADPEGTSQFVDNAAVSTAEPVEKSASDELTDTAVLDCGDDPALLQTRADALTDARDVVRWAILQALTSGASDIHIDPLDPVTAAIRLRLNGVLRIRGHISTGMLVRVLSVIKIRCAKDQTQSRLPQDGKFKVHAKDRDADVRVSTIPVQRGEQLESCVLRILGRVKIPDIHAIGLDDYQLAQAQWILSRDNGMFLITGPTGSGKTTTLNCMLREIAGEGINVMSVEDPVEIQIPWVKQVQTHIEIGFDFKDALRSFLRHDPDVIMLGEIRDAVTAQIAMQASATGHLVFSTLHTNDANSTILRLTDLGIERSVIASTVRGVAAQRLVPCLCPRCREGTKISDKERAYGEKYLARLRRIVGQNPACPDAHELARDLERWLAVGETFRPGGCQVCNQTGFDRRRAILELYLIGNEPTVMDMIVDKAPISAIQRFFDQQGHLDLAGHSLRAVMKHDTTFHEIEKHLPLL